MTTLNIPGNLIRWRFVLLAEAKLSSSRVLRLCHVVFTYPSPRPIGGCKGEGILFCVTQYSMLRGIIKAKLLKGSFNLYWREFVRELAYSFLLDLWW